MEGKGSFALLLQCFAMFSSIGTKCPKQHLLVTSLLLISIKRMLHLNSTLVCSFTYQRDGDRDGDGERWRWEIASWWQLIMIPRDGICYIWDHLWVTQDKEVNSVPKIVTINGMFGLKKHPPNIFSISEVFINSIL